MTCSFILKKRLWHRCFPVNFPKFLGTPFFTEHLKETASKYESEDVKCYLNETEIEMQNSIGEPVWKYKIIESIMSNKIYKNERNRYIIVTLQASDMYYSRRHDCDQEKQFHVKELTRN